MKDNIYGLLPDALLPWFYGNSRELPWRKTNDPYHIWLSEIMLQQTRVEAVKGYYQRFLEACPTIEALANADDAILHKLWEGLGYYSRVRNLKKAAQQIMSLYGGTFPGEYSQVLALPGIGEYTAGAVCSIAFNQPRAAVDGNVLRLITRLTRDATPIDSPALKKQVRCALEAVYPDRAGDFTQALMELGATLCGPNRKPKCEDCPCRSFCRGYLQGDADAYPVKKAKAARREEKRTVFILHCDGSYALRRRPDTGLLAGLWEFPNISGWYSVEDALREVQKLGIRPKEVLRQVHREHIFTHIRWDLQGIYLETAEQSENLHWLTPEQIVTEAALPTAFRRFWEEI